MFLNEYPLIFYEGSFMKKLICLLSMACLGLNLWAYESKVETSEEMKAYLPNQDESLTFKENPVKFLEAIQLDYHFSKPDNGLKRVKEALEYVIPLYEEDKMQAVFPEKLEDGEAYKIYAALHTLKGMLLVQKAKLATAINANNDDADERRAQAIEDMQQAEKSFKLAVEVDPNSAEAYFQLGKYYRNVSAGLESKDAEEAFYNAARLAAEQNNEKGSNQAKAELTLINPNSEYLQRLEK